MLQFKPIYLKRSSSKAIIQLLNSSIISSIKSIQEGSDFEYIKSSNKSNFMDIDLKMPKMYYSQIKLFPGYTNFYKKIEEVNYKESINRGNSLIKQYIDQGKYNMYDPFILDIRLNLELMKFYTYSTFPKAIESILEIISISKMNSNTYIYVKSLLYLSTFYLLSGENFLGKEILLFAISQYESNHINCSDLLFKIIDLYTKNFHDTNKVVSYKQFFNKLKQRCVEYKDLNKSIFIESNNSNSNISDILKKYEVIFHIQNASIKMNLSKHLSSPSEIYENVENIKYSIKVYEEIINSLYSIDQSLTTLYSFKQYSNQINDTSRTNENGKVLLLNLSDSSKLSNEKYNDVPYLNMINYNLGTCYFFKGCLNLISQRDVIAEEYFKKSKELFSSNFFEHINISLALIKFNIISNNYIKSEELIDEFDKLFLSKIDSLPVLQLNYYFFKIYHLLNENKIKTDGRSEVLEKILNTYKLFRDLNAVYFSHSQTSENLCLVNRLLEENGLKSVVNSYSERN